MRSIFVTYVTGRDIFRCVANSNRFASILSCLPFDDPETRLQGIKAVPLAPISDIFGFLENCHSVYTLGTGVCIDEMLVSLRGRPKFKVFMPSKPCKYGLKIMALTDSRTSYLYNAYIYCGKGSDDFGLSSEEHKYSKPTQAVIRLVKLIYESNRNKAADNWFSSIELVQWLKN
nr:unnamed protein product [Callosobruchus analis]